MENLNAEEVKRALECCDGTLAGCKECPNYNNRYRCKIEAEALALIKSYEEQIFALENRLKECENGYEGTLALERAKVRQLNEENERLKALRTVDEEHKFCNLFYGARVYTKTLEDYNKFRKAFRADTVQKMQERLKECFDNEIEHKSIYTESQVLFVINQITKEMLEGKK